MNRHWKWQIWKELCKVYHSHIHILTLGGIIIPFREHNVRLAKEKSCPSACCQKGAIEVM